LEFEIEHQKYFLERRLLSILLEAKKGEGQTMEGNFFNGQGTQSLDSIMDLSALRDEMERCKVLPELMNLYEKVNGFFDSKFESYWEEQTGLPWKEWGKL
jgi:hypothetical protein